VGVFFTFFFLWWGLDRHGVKFEYGFVLKELIKILLASGLMGLAAWATLHFLIQSQMPYEKALQVFGPIFVGALAYFLSAKVLQC
jgi:peptidoglycan biosynthesis protein MviN/MurJ (putative lipid II flippase)